MNGLKSVLIILAEHRQILIKRLSLIFSWIWIKMGLFRKNNLSSYIAAIAIYFWLIDISKENARIVEILMPKEINVMVVVN